MPHSNLFATRTALHEEARQLAGGLTDLAQRATVYHHLFRASDGNHVFPLIAAHGALWAGGYFRFGLRLGQWLSWSSVLPRIRRQRLDQLDAFADVFRDINRRVCIDTYVNFHLTARFDGHPDLVDHVPPVLLEALRMVHRARAAAVPLTDDEKLSVFRAHFLHEQEHVVGPMLTDAVARFNWPLVRAIALRPVVQFAYFPGGQRLWFRNFARKVERVEQGQKAFSLGAQVGWSRVEAALDDYHVLPAACFTDPVEHFRQFRAAIVIGGTAAG
jgi:hypothetical protein